MTHGGSGFGDVERIRNPEREILREEGVLDLDARLDVVVAIGIRNVRLDPGVGEAAALGYTGGLIGKGIRARLIAHLILPDVRTYGERRAGIDDDGPHCELQFLV